MSYLKYNACKKLKEKNVTKEAKKETDEETESGRPRDECLLNPVALHSLDVENVVLAAVRGKFLILLQRCTKKKLS